MLNTFYKNGTHFVSDQAQSKHRPIQDLFGMLLSVVTLSTKLSQETTDIHTETNENHAGKGCLRSDACVPNYHDRSGPAAPEFRLVSPGCPPLPSKNAAVKVPHRGHHESLPEMQSPRLLSFCFSCFRILHVFELQQIEEVLKVVPSKRFHGSFCGIATMVI